GVLAPPALEAAVVSAVRTAMEAGRPVVVRRRRRGLGLALAAAAALGAVLLALVLASHGSATYRIPLAGTAAAPGATGAVSPTAAPATSWRSMASGTSR